MDAFVFYYHKLNRYSFNALFGAAEDILEEIACEKNIYFPTNKQELLNTIQEISKNFKRILIFFSFLSPQVWEIKEILNELQKNPMRGCMSLIVGGPHASALPKDTLSMGFDYVFIGEAEESFRSFLINITKGEMFPKINGIAFRQGDRFISYGKAHPIDLDAYKPYSKRYRILGPIEITRGCPNLCKYCQTPRLFGTRVRHRSIENIIKASETLLEMGIKDLRFITPNAFSYGSTDGRSLNLEVLKTLLKELHGLTKLYNGRIFFGSFPSEVRPEHVIPETISLVKEYCANDNLVIGAQTGSERMLEYLMRGHSVGDVRRAVDLTVKAGLKAKVDFIFGLPGETLDDIYATISLMEELAKKGAVIHAHTFMPLPQTPFMRKRGGDISPEIRKFINRLLPKGKVFGYWERQREIAKKMYDEINMGFRAEKLKFI